MPNTCRNIYNNNTQWHPTEGQEDTLRIGALHGNVNFVRRNLRLIMDSLHI
jgi:hypothetical protein